MIADKKRAAVYIADYVSRIEAAREENDSFLVGYYRELLKTAEEEFRAFYGDKGLTDIQVDALKLLTK